MELTTTLIVAQMFAKNFFSTVRSHVDCRTPVPLSLLLSDPDVGDFLGKVVVGHLSFLDTNGNVSLKGVGKSGHLALVVSIYIRGVVDSSFDGSGQKGFSDREVV